MSVDRAAILVSLSEILKANDLSSITEKKLRRLIEEDLGYPEFALDEPDTKKFLKGEILKLLGKKSDGGHQEKDPAAYESKPSPETEPTGKPVQKRSLASKDKKAVQSPAGLANNGSDTPAQKKKARTAITKAKRDAPAQKADAGVGEDTISAKAKPKGSATPKRAARKTKASEAADPASGNASQPKPLVPPQLQTTKTEASAEGSANADGEDEGLSSLEESDEEKKSAPGRKATPKQSTTRSKGPAQFSDKVAKKINSLKAYVVRCGVRKNWKVTLGDLGPRQQVQKLTQILEELGMKGRPTLEKCKAIAAKEALKRETEGLDLSNIIAEERRPRRARPSINYSKFDAPSPVESDKDAAEVSEESSESEDEWNKVSSSDDEPPAMRKRSRNVIHESEEDAPPGSEKAHSTREAGELELPEDGSNKSSPKASGPSPDPAKGEGASVTISKGEEDSGDEAEDGSIQAPASQDELQEATEGESLSFHDPPNAESVLVNDTGKNSPDVSEVEAKLGSDPYSESNLGSKQLDSVTPNIEAGHESNLASPPLGVEPAGDGMQVDDSKVETQSQSPDRDSPNRSQGNELAETLFADSE
ncbi:hypothetical protein L0F63_003919 [Massospora cicadina]|nr:hypothetical protein L0F63_003919 [Massospora cicadina]